MCIPRCISFLLFLFFIVPNGTTIAEDNGPRAAAPASVPPRVYVAFLCSHGEPSAVQESTYYCVVRRFAAQGFTLTKDPEEHAVFVDATEQAGMVALSFVFGEVIPENVVDLCRNAEVFYSGMSDEQRARLPKDGKWLREMVSEDFIRQFMAPRDSKVMIVERAGAEKAIEGVVEAFQAVHWRKK